jgi:O-antigen ligase
MIPKSGFRRAPDPRAFGASNLGPLAPRLLALLPRRRSVHGVQTRWLAIRITSGWIVGGIMGCWLSLYSLAEFFLRPHTFETSIGFDSMREASPIEGAALALVLLLGVIPMAGSAALFGVDFRRIRYLGFVALFVCLSIPLSYLTATEFKAVLYVILVFFVFAYTVIGASANLDPEEFLRGLGLGLAISHSLVFVLIMLDHDAPWGRLIGRMSPNYWGMAAQATIISCIVVRTWPIRIIAVGIGAAILIWTQARGSMVAVSAGLGVAFLLHSMRSRVSIWAWLAAATVCVLVGTFGYDLIADKVLLLSDTGRGLGSGFTGRTSAWRETLDLFASHPLFGVGYRQHEQYVTSAVSAHNAYLATLADVGVVGALAYFLFLFGGLAVATLKTLRHISSGRIMCAAFLTAYVVNGVFERNALNTGNAYSMLLILICCWSWRQDTPRRYLPWVRQRSNTSGAK